MLQPGHNTYVSFDEQDLSRDEIFDRCNAFLKANASKFSVRHDNAESFRFDFTLKSKYVNPVANGNIAVRQRKDGFKIAYFISYSLFASSWRKQYREFQRKFMDAITGRTSRLEK